MHKTQFQSNWVKIDASNGAVTFRAHNNSVHWMASLKSGVVIDQGGQVKCFIPALKCISDGIKISDSEDVTISKEEGLIKIVSGYASFDIGSGDVSEFSEIPTFKEEHEIEIPCEEFRAVAKRVLSVYGGSDPFIGVEMSKKKMMIWTTDSRRLVKDSVPISSDIESKFSISHNVLRCMQSLANSKDGKFKFIWSDRDGQMRFDDTTVNFGISDYGIQQVHQILEMIRQNPIKAKMDTTQLRSILSTFVFFAESGENEKPPPMLLKLGKGVSEIEIENKNQGKGCARWKIPCMINDDVNLSIKLNPTYLFDFTSGLLGSKMELSIKDPKSAIHIKFHDVPQAQLDIDRTTRVSSADLECALSPIWMG